MVVVHVSRGRVDEDLVHPPLASGLEEADTHGWLRQTSVVDDGMLAAGIGL